MSEQRHRVLLRPAEVLAQAGLVVELAGTGCACTGWFMASSHTSHSCRPPLPKPCQLCSPYPLRMDFGLALLLHTHTQAFSWHSNTLLTQTSDTPVGTGGHPKWNEWTSRDGTYLWMELLCCTHVHFITAFFCLLPWNPLYSGILWLQGKGGAENGHLAILSAWDRIEDAHTVLERKIVWAKHLMGLCTQGEEPFDQHILVNPTYR